jgi:hypothetical protein
VDYNGRYTTQSGKNYFIKFSYNEKIGERDGFDAFIKSLEVLDSDKRPVTLPTNAAKFSTYENLTAFGSYASINYQGVREAAIEGLRTKILTRLEDHLEGLG